MSDHRKRYKVDVGDVFKDKMGEDVTVIARDTSARITFQWKDGYTRVCQSSVVHYNRLMRESDSKYFNTKYKVGDRFTTYQGAVIELIEYDKASEALVKFIDFDNSIRRTNIGNIVKGHVNHPMLPSLAGVGILGTTDKINTLSGSYVSWVGMLKRVYTPKPGVQTINYAGCTVVEEWKTYINFREWFDSQIKEEGFQLDKDLLQKGNKCYCPDSCVLIPRDINVFLTNRSNHRGSYPVGVTYHARINKYQATCNVSGKSQYLGVYENLIDAFNSYKKRKEEYARELAQTWKGRIDERAYNALIKFEVNLED